MRPQIKDGVERLAAQVVTASRRASELTEGDDDEDLVSFVSYLSTTCEWMASNGRELKGWAYRNYYDLVLDLSAGARRAPLVLPEWLEPMEPQQCFANCYALAFELPDEVTYVEGYALHSLIPVHHAWLELADGTIVDPTWVNLIDDGPDSALYMGVRIHRRLLLRLSELTHYASVIGGDVETGHRLLQHGFEVDATGAAISRKDLA